jgi:hypothetical protein
MLRWGLRRWPTLLASAVMVVVVAAGPQKAVHTTPAGAPTGDKLVPASGHIAVNALGVVGPGNPPGPGPIG